MNEVTMDKTKDLRNLPHLMEQKSKLMRQQQDEDAQMHNTAQLFAKVNAMVEQVSKVSIAMEKMVETSRSYWNDINGKVSDLDAKMNTIIGTLAASGKEIIVPPPVPQRKTRKSGCAEAVSLVLSDGKPIHVFQLGQTLKELDEEGWPDATINNVLSVLVLKGEIQKIQRGVYQLKAKTETL